MRAKLSTATSSMNISHHQNQQLGKVTLDQVEVGMKDSYPTDKHGYELRGQMGKGSSALVSAAKVRSRDELVAIKRINMDRIEVKFDELLKEIQVMSSCMHPNVVKFYTSFVVGHELWLIMKLMAGGSLLDVIKANLSKRNCYNGVLDEIVIATVMREVLLGIEYFHSNGQIHRDIKAGNILLSLDGSVKIADFGVSAFLNYYPGEANNGIRKTFVGTPCWMAPEVMDQAWKGYNAKADIWSFGILGLELATGAAPYARYPPLKVLLMTVKQPPPTLETCEQSPDQYKRYGKQFRKMIECCLKKDALERYSAKGLLKLDFFKKAKDKKFLSRFVVNVADSLYYTEESCQTHDGRLSNAEPKKTAVSVPLDWNFDDDINNTKNNIKTSLENNVPGKRDVSGSEGGAASDRCDMPAAVFELHEHYESDSSVLSTTCDDVAISNCVIEVANHNHARNKGIARDDSSLSDINANDLLSLESLSCAERSPSDVVTEKPQIIHGGNNNSNGSKNCGCCLSCCHGNGKVVKLSMRVRNAKGAMHDIQFPFDRQIDTCGDVVGEMINHGYIFEADRVVVTTSMHRVLTDTDSPLVRFELPSALMLDKANSLTSIFIVNNNDDSDGYNGNDSGARRHSEPVHALGRQTTIANNASH